MFVNYKRTTEIPTLINAGVNEDGLYVSGQWTTAGAPTNTPDIYIAGALIQNIVDANVYQNTGTTAVPNFQAIGAGGGPSTNIYNTDGLLTGGRTLDGDGNNLSLTNILTTQISSNFATIITGAASANACSITMGTPDGSVIVDVSDGNGVIELDSAHDIVLEADNQINITTQGNTPGSVFITSNDFSGPSAHQIEVNYQYIDFVFNSANGELKFEGVSALAGQIMVAGAGGGGPLEPGWDYGAAGAIPSYATTGDAAADGGLASGAYFRVTNGDGTAAVHRKD